MAPDARALADSRAHAAALALDRHRPAARALAQPLAAGDPGARDELAALADRALDDMRDHALDHARRAGSLARIAAELDARWCDPSLTEHLDDPALDPAVRESIMTWLDRYNRRLGSYALFLSQLEPLIAEREGEPTRVLDLAAGHGGFALFAARAARDRGLALSFTATDLRREYLDLGADVARREGLAVEFAVQDALDLSEVAGTHDVILCTQSLHHFTAGMVAVMFEAAVRAARRAVLFIDGSRSVALGLGIGALGVIGSRNLHFAHDAWVSGRRFYAPEELELLARLGPWGDRAEVFWAPPGYCVVRARRGY